MYYVTCARFGIEGMFRKRCYIRLRDHTDTRAAYPFSIYDMLHILGERETTFCLKIIFHLLTPVIVSKQILLWSIFMLILEYLKQ